MTRLLPSRPVTKPPESPSLVARVGTRAISALVAGLMAVAVPLPAMAGPAEIDTNYQGPDATSGSARALTQQGQASFDAGDYRGAALAWQKILDILPENALNRAERENALLIALEAYKHAFRRASLERGSVTTEDVELLREGLALCDAYTKEVSRVHGPGGVSPAVVESRVELEGMLQGSRPTEARTPAIIPVASDTMLERNVVGRGPSGNGLIAAGSASIVVGLAMMPLVIIGAKNAKEAEADIQDAMSMDDASAQSDAEDRKRTGNAMIISGSVLMGVLTIGGATMLGIGIRRRIRYTAFAPVMGPRYVGLSLRHRF